MIRGAGPAWLSFMFKWLECVNSCRQYVVPKLPPLIPCFWHSNCKCRSLTTHLVRLHRCTRQRVCERESDTCVCVCLLEALSQCNRPKEHTWFCARSRIRSAGRLCMGPLSRMTPRSSSSFSLRFSFCSLVLLARAAASSLAPLGVTSFKASSSSSSSGAAGAHSRIDEC